MTKKIAICNLKGGTGKTTSSMLLATALANIGHDVVVYDADPQGNATAWAEHAEGTNAALPFTVHPANKHTMRADSGADFAVIDCPPAYPQIIDVAIDAADFVLIPTGHSTLDAEGVWAIAETLRDNESAGEAAKWAVLMTMANPRTLTYRELEEAMREDGFRIAPVAIPRLEAVKRMIGTRPEGDLYGYNELADYITKELG